MSDMPFADLSAEFFTDFVNPALADSHLSERDIQAARTSLAQYGMALHPEWKNNWHHLVMAEALEDVARGIECGEYRQIVAQFGEDDPRAAAYRARYPGVVERPVEPHHLIITMPSGAAKSEWGSLLNPTWLLGQHPDWSLIFACYNAERALVDGARARNVVAEHPTYRTIFPDVEVDRSQFAASNWKVKGSSQRSSMISVGVGGSATGFRAHAFIIDDPIKKPDEAVSEAVMESHWKWFTGVALKRLLPGVGACVIIMTRWSADDLVGRITDLNLPDWRVLRIPALAEEEETWELRDGTTFTRAEGEALWPEWGMTKESFESSRALDPQTFQAMDQGNPIPDGGLALKPEWLRACTAAQWEESASWPVVYGVDPSTGLGRDYTVIAKLRWNPVEGYAILAELVRGKWGIADLITVLLEHDARDNPFKIVAESNAFQAMIVTHIKDVTLLPLEKSHTSTSKVATHGAIYGTGRQFMAGSVLMPPPEHEGPGHAQFRIEWGRFPRGRNDDTLDAVAKAIEGAHLSIPTEASGATTTRFGQPPARTADGAARLQRAVASRLQPNDLVVAGAPDEIAAILAELSTGAALLGAPDYYIQHDGHYVVRAANTTLAHRELAERGVFVLGRYGEISEQDEKAELELVAP